LEKLRAMCSPNAKLKGTKTNVALKIAYDDTGNRFLIEYGAFNRRYTQVESGETISDALLELAENINDGNKKASVNQIKKVRQARDISLDISLRSTEPTEYIAVIKDGETTITGTGRSTSRAFKNLGKKNFTIKQIGENI